jgi:16S rRNA G966 N2-methylase RsmD
MVNKREINSLIIKISREVGISVKKILDMLYLLRSGNPVENDHLLQKIGVSKNVLNQTKKLLFQILEDPSKETQLRKDYLPAMQDFFHKNYSPEESLWGFLQDEDFKKTSKLIEECHDYRPSPDRKYDQFTATVETTAIRASLLNFYEDIREKRLLFLGDDDFTSIAAASFKKASEVCVLDIDDRILDKINFISEKNKLGINVINCDIRKALPDLSRHKFDVVFTDPPYTEEGMKLFLSRAVESLDLTNSAARIYACYGNSDRAKERFLPINRILIDLGLMTRWVFDKFNRYQGAESIGSTSSLFICEVTPKTKPIILGEYYEPIYTHN